LSTAAKLGTRNTQRGDILRLLIEAKGGWVPLPEILALGIAQYNARIFELRGLGFNIENRTETDAETGARHSWFRLLNSPLVRSRTPEPLKSEPRWEDRPRVTGLPLFDLAVRP
jgi:hypothetical protein